MKLKSTIAKTVRKLQVGHELSIEKVYTGSFMTYFNMKIFSFLSSRLIRLFFNVRMTKLKLVIGLGGIMSLYSSALIIPWDPGELNFYMAATACDNHWSGLLFFFGLLNFVFDRCKFLM